MNGHGTAPDNQTLEAGAKAVKPDNPSQTGYTFDRWYTDIGLTAKVDFATWTMPAADTTLYAKWRTVITGVEITGDPVVGNTITARATPRCDSGCHYILAGKGINSVSNSSGQFNMKEEYAGKQLTIGCYAFESNHYDRDAVSDSFTVQSALVTVTTDHTVDVTSEAVKFQQGQAGSDGITATFNGSIANANAVTLYRDNVLSGKYSLKV